MMKKNCIFVSVVILMIGIAGLMPSFGRDKGIILTEEDEGVTQTRNIKSIAGYTQSKRWAIIIGINNYEDEYIADLTKSRNDAKALSDVLSHEGQFDYVFSFTDDESRTGRAYASLNNIVAKMELLKEYIKPEDTLLFSFSGHGVADDEGESYLLMGDSLVASPYLTGLPVSAVTDWINDLGVKRNIVLLDACRNYVEKTKSMTNYKMFIAANDKLAEVSAILYATSPGRFSYEHDREPYSVFTAYLLEGLKGRADSNHDVIVTFNELRHYVEEMVGDWSVRNNKIQKPYTLINGEFHGDVILSIIPHKERAKYNPNMIRYSYKKQLLTYNIISATSLVTAITCFAGSVTGAVLFSVGYVNYQMMQSGDFSFYYAMELGGYISMTVTGTIGLLTLIPFIVSYIMKRRIKNIKQLMPEVRYHDKTITVGLSVRPVMFRKWGR